MKKSFSEIETCYLILVELSEKGAGIGIEAGYVSAKKIPIFTIAKTGCDISETLISSHVYVYDKTENLKLFFAQLTNLL
jgi:nucleoside 2-deoxyribosyltransferase